MFNEITNDFVDEIENNDYHAVCCTTNQNDKTFYLVAFPTKYDWKERSKLLLIKRSAETIKKITDIFNWQKILLPRPGCDLGGLKWQDVSKMLEPILDNRFYIIDRKK